MNDTANSVATVEAPQTVESLQKANGSLEETAKMLVRGQRGLLAMDESNRRLFQALRSFQAANRASWLRLA